MKRRKRQKESKHRESTWRNVFLFYKIRSANEFYFDGGDKDNFVSKVAHHAAEMHSRKWQIDHWIHGKLDTLWNSARKNTQVYGAAMHYWEGSKQKDLCEDMWWHGIYLRHAAHFVSNEPF